MRKHRFQDTNHPGCAGGLVAVAYMRAAAAFVRSYDEATLACLRGPLGNVSPPRLDALATRMAQLPLHIDGLCLGSAETPRIAVHWATVLWFDASAELRLRLPRSSSDIAVDELVYADDTMVVAVDASRAETYMSCIASAGMDYGLCFNWRKVEASPIRCNFRVLKPDGCSIECKSSMICLGSLAGRIVTDLAI